MVTKNYSRPGLLGAIFLLLLVFISPPSVDGKPLEFFQQLEGTHKGNTVKGVQQLKQYLNKFGYLHSTHANDDEYDDLVESAVKTYQLNYGLNVTGSLDPETLKEMMKPRCGVPDIINGKNVMSSGKKKKQHERRLSLRTTSHFAFFDGNLRWSKTHLTYTFLSQVEAVDIETLRYVISRAFSRWAAVTQFTFAEAQDGSSADIVIGFYKLDHGDGPRNAFDGPGPILAHAFPPEAGIFHYDGDQNWSTNPTSRDQADLESTAVHELGHVLGLQHSDVPEAIMFPSIKPGGIKRDLQEDDVQGIRTLYGLSA